MPLMPPTARVLKGPSMNPNKIDVAQRQRQIAIKILEGHQIVDEFPLNSPKHEFWLTIWMMMVGCNYLLVSAKRFRDVRPMNHRKTEVFARQLQERLSQGDLMSEDKWP